MKKTFAALALAAIAQVASAQTPAQTPAGWERATSPDGRVSVAMPCKAAELDRFQDGDGWRIICQRGDLMFVATSGIGSVDDGEIVTFEAMREMTLKEIGPSRVDQTPVLGRKAFTIPCGDLKDVPCILQIDARPEHPLLLGVVGVNGPGSADPAKIDQNSKDARQFYQSLELKAQ